MRYCRIVGLIGVLMTASGCSPPDREAELRALIAEAESAAESRDTSFFRGVIGADYVDASGRRRDEIIGLIRGYFLINNRIEVINRIQEIRLDGDAFATIALQSAVGGNAVGGSVLDIDADFYAIDLELAREGSDWQIIGAAWNRILD
jgi:hypothetical protein